jgi:branched-chain amino acid transport system ATP-binding protein
VKKMNVLKVEGISVSYGPIEAVDDVSIYIDEGEIVSLVGANGAGKTSLLRGIMGLDKVSTGTITFMGNDITNMSTDKVAGSGIGLIPEGHLVFSTMTVLENLQVGGYRHPQAVNSGLESVFESFPVLYKRRDQIAGTLSGGEQQMLSIGRTLMSQPKLLMADEPSLGLAPKVINEIFNILRELNENGYPILLSEQNAKKALQFCDRAYVMETGRVVIQGSARELMGNPRVRQAYLGG